VHCALGTSIKNFAAYNGAGTAQNQDLTGSDSANKSVNGTSTSPATATGQDHSQDATASHTAETIKHIFGFVGLGLCVGIFIYLFSVARKAVDEELDEEDGEEGALGIDDYEVVFSDEEEEGEWLEGDEEGKIAKGSDVENEDFTFPRGSSESALDGNSTAKLSCSHRSMGLEGDGMTPSNSAARLYSEQHNPYFNPSPSSFNATRTSRHMESQVSLADSIVEMEKHAIELEQEPLFYNKDRQ
jgi:hypothetical protein